MDSKNEWPICLIENTEKKEFQVNPEAIKILSEIDQHVVVVTIAGLYRTGKSYLMNRLSGRKAGFPLGSTVESKTKGIWMWCVSHPSKVEQTLVLLDTEGLGDVQKGDRKNDTWIFSLAVLLSSTLVYNNIGAIDNFALENLYFVTELAEFIKVKTTEDEEDGTNLVQFFPQFVWVVRDMTLKLEIDNRKVTADQYLEKSLALKKGVTPSISAFNMPRLCIRQYFPSRKCFTFVRPINGNDFEKLELLKDQDLDPVFLRESHNFCEYILQNAPVKTVKGGYRLTGKLFGILVQNYVKMIVSGQVPCMENAVIALATMENEQAVQEALTQYQSQMEESITFPTEDKDLSEIHTICEKKALQTFMKRSFKDENHKYQQRLAESIEKMYSDFQEKNQATSREICRVLLENLSVNLNRNLSEGVYSKPGGFLLYTKDRDLIVQSFKRTPCRGVKAEEMLSLYLESRKVEAQTILQADKNLSGQQKRLNEERERALLLEQCQRLEEEKRIQIEQRLMDQEISHQENIRQLTKKMEFENDSLRMELECAMESKLREQELLLTQGFKGRADAMSDEISSLKEEMKSLAKKMNPCKIN